MPFLSSYYFLLLFLLQDQPGKLRTGFFFVCVCVIMNKLHDWPEPVIRVQSLSESGLKSIPERYIKPATDRPSLNMEEDPTNMDVNIPIIDLTGLSEDGNNLPQSTMDQISLACREWGFFSGCEPWSLPWIHGSSTRNLA